MVSDPVVLFERAAQGAVVMVAKIGPDQWDAPTPCTEWDVRALVEHMAGGPAYLAAALGLDAAPAGIDADGYATAVGACVAALREPGALDRRCQSPAGFEWSVAEAAAGTAMDQLVHTWDLAVAVGAGRTLDPDVADAVVAMFLPDMPRIGREAGFVGPEVQVPADSPAQDRLVAAMGRRP